MEIRTVKKQEAKQLAEIHLDTFKGFFLSSLGKSFLTTYYNACLNSDEAINICAVDENNKLVGFCVGSRVSKGFNKNLLLSNFLSFLFQGMNIVLTKPKALIRLFKNLDKNANPIDDGNYAELLSIGVLTEIKGKGVGNKMIYKFEEVAIQKGCKRLSLTTDYNNNADVLNFYKKSGYEIFYEFVTYPNRKMYKLIKDLKN